MVQQATPDQQGGAVDDSTLLTSERLRLRRVVNSDVDDIGSLLAVPDVWAALGQPAAPAATAVTQLVTAMMENKGSLGPTSRRYSAVMEGVRLLWSDFHQATSVRCREVAPA